MTPDASIDYSLVVCTYNRAQDLRELLETALRLETGGGFDYEVLVVDNNSSDDTAAVAQEFVQRAGGRVRYLFEGRQGKSYALNTALDAARGRVFTIADDDFLLPPDWLLRIDAAFQRHPEAAYVSGKVLPQWLGTPPAWLGREHWSPLALADYGESEFFADEGRRVCLLACSFRRDLVQAVGGYDVRLGVSGSRTGGTEDLEIQERLWAAGHRGLYAPEVWFRHKVSPTRATRRYLRRWHRHHGRSHGAMYVSSPERSRGETLRMAVHHARRALAGLGRAARARLRRDAGATASHEADAFFCLGFVEASLPRLVRAR